MNIMCWPTAKCAGKVVGEGSTFSNDIEACNQGRDVPRFKLVDIVTMSHLYEPSTGQCRNFLSLYFFAGVWGCEPSGRVLKSTVPSTLVLDLEGGFGTWNVESRHDNDFAILSQCTPMPARDSEQP